MNESGQNHDEGMPGRFYSPLVLVSQRLFHHRLAVHRGCSAQAFHLIQLENTKASKMANSMASKKFIHGERNNRILHEIWHLQEQALQLIQLHLVQQLDTRICLPTKQPGW